MKQYSVCNPMLVADMNMGPETYKLSMFLTLPICSKKNAKLPPHPPLLLFSFGGGGLGEKIMMLNSLGWKELRWSISRAF